MFECLLHTLRAWLVTDCLSLSNAVLRFVAISFYIAFPRTATKHRIACTRISRGMRHGSRSEGIERSVFFSPTVHFIHQQLTQWWHRQRIIAQNSQILVHEIFRVMQKVIVFGLFRSTCTRPSSHYNFSHVFAFLCCCCEFINIIVQQVNCTAAPQKPKIECKNQYRKKNMNQT